MTDEIMDTCKVDGKILDIVDWDGSDECIPDNEKLGIETVSASTANFDGRINHFQIHNNQLYLFKIEVELAEQDVKKYLSVGDRHETQILTEKMKQFSEDGMQIVEKVSVRHFIIFDNLKIPFNGSLHLSFPSIDLWNTPAVADEDLDPPESSWIYFDDGIVRERINGL